jgi:hypothetical protein
MQESFDEWTFPMVSGFLTRHAAVLPASSSLTVGATKWT